MSAAEIHRARVEQDLREGAPPVDPAEAWARAEHVARLHAEKVARYEAWARRWPGAAAAFEERCDPRLRQQRLAKLVRRSPSAASLKGPAKPGPAAAPPPLLTRDLVEAMLQPILALSPAAREAGVERILNEQRQRWRSWATLHPRAAAAYLQEHPERRALVE